MAAHSSILALRIPWTEEPDRPQSMELDTTKQLSYLLTASVCTHTHTHTHTRSCCLAAQSYLSLYDPMDDNPPDSSVHGISQARVLEWVAISFSRGYS